ncbi:MAG: alpha/beta hydrolase [Acetatifactor sp.]|nr:alpha/beta hydrolase [Acetatifactor sp.]
MRYFQVNVREHPTELGYMPTLWLYLLEERDKPRPIVIIAPGGGYVSVNAEEDRVVSQYNAAGFHAAVLQYSVSPHCFPEPERDMMLAIGLVRERAEEWGILKDRVAICGFSAGGHLCACVSTLWKKMGEERFKPDAAILCHAVLTARLNHCRNFIAGHVGSVDQEAQELAFCDRQVSNDTPPTFLYTSFEDKLANVENVLYYGEMLAKYEVPFEMHVLPKGGHCAPWCDDTIWAKPASGRDYNYIRMSVEWMRELWAL